MAGKVTALPLLVVAFLLAASAATAQISAGKEIVMFEKKQQGGITEQIETEGFKQCLSTIYNSGRCLHDVFKMLYFGTIYMSKECCHKFFVMIGEDCVLAALRFFYPFNDDLTKLLKEFCAGVGPH